MNNETLQQVALIKVKDEMFSEFCNFINDIEDIK